MSVRVDTERVLWSGKLTRTTRTATRKPRSMMSWMSRPVEDVYGQWLAIPTEWTPAQRKTFLGAWTEYLDGKASEMAMDLGEAAVAQWRDQHGRHPDFLTAVRLRETAMENAREAVVRQELYDRIPLTEDGDPVPPEPVSGVPWEKRWMDPRYRIGEVEEAVADHVRLVWPDHSPMFRALAAWLLTARLEDHRPVPRTRRDQLAHDLVPEVNEMLGRMNRPPE